MNPLLAAVAGLALLGLLAAPLRAGEDCNTVVKSLEDALLVATKTVDDTMEEIKKASTQAADDKSKASVKNSFCSLSGEYLGTSRAFRAVAAECLQGDKRRATLATLDQSIRSLESSIENTCK
jgi:hypothetical protein